MRGPLKRALSRNRWNNDLTTKTTIPWVESSGMYHRNYISDVEYFDHQKSKLEALGDFVNGVDHELEQVLADRIPVVTGRSVLCLGARLGGEVRAFRSAGAFAVGIDLNPGTDNCWVLPGDFHELDFAGASVDLVYTNSLDHARDLPRVASEMVRVLKPQGAVVLEVTRGSAEGGSFGAWEATTWERIDDVVAVFTATGLTETCDRLDFDKPWAGQQVRLIKVG